ncbi:MAG: phosphoribosyltransferase [Actinobacteria bacterium]|nr:phosphoribosyltransferase [Actinomycetota bacterium]
MQYQPVLYKNRTDAGIKLGQTLKKINLDQPVVLAIPFGGVPVGKEVARVLNALFDLIITRKIQYPWTTEAGFGAVTADGTAYYGPEAKTLPKEVVETQTLKAKKEVEQRKKRLLKGRKRISLKDRTVILIDDGLATGSSMLAAIQSIKKEKPAKIIVAVPTASGRAVKLIKPHVDQLISPYIHPEYLPFAVASSYQNWYDLSEEEALDYLK